MLFSHRLVEKAPLWITFEVNFTEILAKTVKLYVYQIVETIFLIFKLKLHFFNLFLNFLNNLRDDVFLSLDKEFTVLLHDLTPYVGIKVKFFNILFAEHWILVWIHLLCDMLTNIEQVACTFIALCASQCFFCHLLLWDWKSSMIIEHPPLFLDPVPDIRVIMPVLSEAIVHNYSMQVVWLLFVLDVWLSQYFLNCWDLGADSIHLWLSCISKSS